MNQGNNDGPCPRSPAPTARQELGRRAFVHILAAGLLGSPLPADAQPAGRVARVGVLSGASATEHVYRLLPAALRELGYVEGKNLDFQWRWAEGRAERLPELADDLVRLKVDAIVAVTNQPILAAKRATTSIPIVMIAGLDPVAFGLVASLARPGGNVTGTSASPPEIGGKILEVLKEAIPGADRVTLVWDPSFPGMAPYADHAAAVARALNISLTYADIRNPADTEEVLGQIGRRRPHALYVVPFGPLAAQLPRIFDFAAKQKLPAIYTGWGATIVEAGGLMSYGPNLDETYRRSATFIDKILKGAPPAALPVEQPRKFDFIVNLRTAKALGLTIAPSALMRADRVIQ
ncbi:MAG: ABC transporter substrate-binding protein [Candidatus Rokuibacteriota bacterium]